ncbi:hypothetical protein QVD17_17488 [Tagetes erecta]|uniref:Uncharacterized protein n=1 Tax=Tagetes erecta TaxID=13708 RepID=A0AAD8KU03_TARER|nr:hypothetical protein QVD17_17488 [Tagetes erecta]
MREAMPLGALIWGVSRFNPWHSHASKQQYGSNYINNKQEQKQEQTTQSKFNPTKPNKRSETSSKFIIT